MKRCVGGLRCCQIAEDIGRLVWSCFRKCHWLFKILLGRNDDSAAVSWNAGNRWCTNDFWLSTFSYLDPVSLARCKAVCRSWNSWASDDELWHKKFNLYFGSTCASSMPSRGWFSEVAERWSAIHGKPGRRFDPHANSVAATLFVILQILTLFIAAIFIALPIPASIYAFGTATVTAVSAGYMFVGPRPIDYRARPYHTVIIFLLGLYSSILFTARTTWLGVIPAVIFLWLAVVVYIEVFTAESSLLPILCFLCPWILCKFLGPSMLLLIPWFTIITRVCHLNSFLLLHLLSPKWKEYDFRRLTHPYTASFLMEFPRWAPLLACVSVFGTGYLYKVLYPQGGLAPCYVLFALISGWLTSVILWPEFRYFCRILI
ncbi:hypothetical protein Pelo_15 [Pelomyxa schiedti]|nr:hypothetical protein Pelo_15 [Pelomyxa schiedti]